MHVVVIEPGLTNRDRVARRQQIADPLRGVVRPGVCFVRMDSGGRRKPRRTAGERQCALAAGDGLADHHDVPDARSFGAGQHGVAIGVERGIAEVTVRVD